MKKTALVILALLGAICASAADYSKTLRLDYILTGTAKESSISLVKMKMNYLYVKDKEYV